MKYIELDDVIEPNTSPNFPEELTQEIEAKLNDVYGDALVSWSYVDYLNELFAPRGWIIEALVKVEKSKRYYTMEYLDGVFYNSERRNPLVIKNYISLLEDILKSGEFDVSLRNSDRSNFCELEIRKENNSEILYYHSVSAKWCIYLGSKPTIFNSFNELLALLK